MTSLSPPRGDPPDMENMPPKKAPDDLTLRAKPRPVKRINRRALIIAAAVVITAITAVTFWSLRPTSFRLASPATELYNVERVARTEALDRLPPDYAQIMPSTPRTAPPSGPPLPGDFGPALLGQQEQLGRFGMSDTVDADSAEQLAREAEAAASQIFFNTGRSGPAGGAPRPAQASTAPPALPATAGEGDATADQNRQGQKQAFMASASPNIQNDGDFIGPGSAYQVMAGTVIAAALVTGINSDLPGDVIATVTEPVYDTATGRHVLIPQGSRILGRYNSQVTYGQTRVQVVWNRIIRPDTSSITLDNLVGTDMAGMSGLEDGVDWHWRRLLAGAAMSTLLGMGAELATPDRQGSDRLIIAGRDAMQDSINQVGQEMSRRNLNIQPTLTSRPGLPVMIIVNRDLELRPYQTM